MSDLLNIALSNAVAAAVLALIAAAAGSVCRRPALVHGLWLLVLLKLVTPPLARIPVSWPRTEEPRPVPIAASAPEVSLPEAAFPPEPSGRPEELAGSLVLPAVTEEATPSSEPTFALSAPPVADPPRWPQALLLAWIAGSLGWFGLALTRLARFRRLLRFARPALPAFQERTRRLSRRLGLTRCPRVGLLPGRLAPMLWAVGGSPWLLLPAELLDVLGDDELDTLLVHELAHLRRRDHWVRALEFVVMGLYWWHPVVWYARRELREAEELCCDAWVVSTLPGAGRTYATALMDTLDFLSTARPAVPPLASGLGQISDLKRRLTMIMRGTTPRALSWPGCLTILTLGAFFLPMLPALQAQAPLGKEEQEKEAITIRLENKFAQPELEASQAELKKLEVDLERKRAELAAAKARLKAAADKLRADEEKKAAQHERAKAEQDKAAKELYRRDIEKAKIIWSAEKPMVRIEILVPAGSDTNIKDLLKKIEAVLPETKPGVKVRVAPAYGTAVEVVPNKAQFHYDKSIKVPVPAPPVSVKPGATNAPQDKRINDLEKKLEKVLQELHDLRKEMKQPRSGAGNGAPNALPGSTAPIAPTPAIPRAPAPSTAPPSPGAP